MKDNEREIGEVIKFESIRRITGYLVETTDCFNNGKKVLEYDCVKYSTTGIVPTVATK